MAELSSHPTINRLYQLLMAAPDALTVYQAGDQLPAPLPPAFVVIQPLFGIMNQQWATRRFVIQHLQVTCCAHGAEATRNLVQAVNKRLPATEFVITNTAPENRSSSHFEIPVTIQRIT